MANQLFFILPPRPRDAPLLEGHRKEDVWWELLDQRDRPIGALEGVLSGSVDLNQHTDTRGSGQLEYLGPLAGDDWLDVRVRPWLRISNASGASMSIPWGVYLPSVPASVYRDGHTPTVIELEGKLQLLIEEQYSNGKRVRKGAVVTDQIKAMLAPAWMGRVVVVDSAERARSEQWWDPGTSVLEIVNDLLESIGYRALYTDRNGVIRAEPRLTPADRRVHFGLRDDGQGVYSPDLTRTHDYSQVPNEYQIISTTDGDAPPIVGVARDFTSKFSRANRGRNIVAREENVEVTSQRVADRMAAQKLADAQRTTATWDLETLKLPLWPGDAVDLVSARHGAETLTTVESMRVDLTPGTLVGTRLREVQG
ncbi:hypothetical protein [Micrococcus terreus]|uniref:hypothetical protein n=1 Tax=Micrococcus terreus TaxID=574650 RepID=UPI003D737E6E